MNTLVIINILFSFPLLMIMNQIANNTIIDNRISRYYVLVVVLTVCELYLEIISAVVLDKQGEIAILINKIVNGVGFSLTPFVTYNLMMMQLKLKSKKQKHLLAVPLFINTIICMASIKTEWIFYVTADNGYHRGDLFILPLIISMLYLVIFCVDLIWNCDHNSHNDILQYIIIVIMVLVGITIQVLFGKITVLWGTTAIALTLYYMLLREQQFRYDVLTNVQNRFRYNKAISDMADKSFTLVSVDLNRFKKINDTYGHVKGDEVLYNAANLLMDNFQTIGNVFRIGGDEFCIICNRLYDKVEIDKKFVEMNLVTTLNPDKFVEPELFAYGIADYNPEQNVDMQEIINLSDNAMYEYKNNFKNRAKSS